MTLERDRALWGEDAEAVRAAADALAGHHPERGGRELEQAAYAVVRALRPFPGRRGWRARVEARMAFVAATAARLRARARARG